MISALDLPTLDARAAGLRAKLFSRAELEAMAGAPSVASLARELEQAGRALEPIERPATTVTLESAIRRTAARHLGILARWAGPGSVLDVFYADQDRRSLRALIRGALQGAPAEERLSGLLPTRRLPERALTLLARQATPGRVTGQLTLLGDPDAAPLSALTARAQPVLLELERVLVRGFAERSLAAARGADRHLRRTVRTRIDLCNLEMALAFVAGPRDVDPASLFTPGGEALSPSEFVDACKVTSAASATTRLERALAGSPLESVLRASSGNPVRLETLALRQALELERATARVDPLGSAPLALFLLRLQCQGFDLRRLAWGAALGAPAELVRPELVTPWS